MKINFMSLYEIAEVIISSLELALSLGGLILIIFGWIVLYKQNAKIEENRQKAEQYLKNGKKNWSISKSHYFMDQYQHYSKSMM